MESARTAKKKDRGAFRLVSDVCQLGHDAPAWTSRLMDGLAEAFNARFVALAWATLPEKPGQFNRSEVALHRGLSPDELDIWLTGYHHADTTFQSEFLRRVINIPSKFVTVRRQDVMSDEEWYAQPEVEGIHRPCNIDANLASYLVVTSRQRLFGIGVHRKWGAPQFTVEERRRLRLIHMELAREWRHRLIGPAISDPVIQNLSPRLQQVLWLLCAGKSEKEIAWQLKLSTNTIHNHTRRLHNALGVHSRGELLARALARAAQDNVAMPADRI